MEITKTMKSFNVEQYNDEINKLNKMIKTINDLNYLFICWGAEEEMPKEWFESLLTLPFISKAFIRRNVELSLRTFPQPLVW